MEHKSIRELNTNEIENVAGGDGYWDAFRRAAIAYFAASSAIKVQAQQRDWAIAPRRG